MIGGMGATRMSPMAGAGRSPAAPRIDALKRYQSRPSTPLIDAALPKPGQGQLQQQQQNQMQQQRQQRM